MSQALKLDAEDVLAAIGAILIGIGSYWLGGLPGLMIYAGCLLVALAFAIGSARRKRGEGTDGSDPEHPRVARPSESR